MASHRHDCRFKPGRLMMLIRADNVQIMTRSSKDQQEQRPGFQERELTLLCRQET
ncbi:MAG: hypothetical protein IPM88_21100 [Nitrospira sp.]|nr:hypothetical protein [Nitrospira sp.]